MFKVSCSLLLLVTLAGCGGSGSSSRSTPTPTPTPAGALNVCAQAGDGSCTNPAVVGFGGTAQFTATANSGTLPPLNWSVNGVQGGNAASGTISASGLYTAPNPFDSGKSVKITATSQSDSSVNGSGSAVVVNNVTKENAPVILGTSGGNVTDSVSSGKTITCCSGTLGALIKSGSNFFILSNNHVLAKSDRGAVGDAIGQPGLIDNNCAAGTTVANLTAFGAVKPNPCGATPCTGAAPSNVDAAIAKIVSGAVDPSGTILDLGGVNGAGIDPAPPSSTLADPATVLANNEGVAKVGRSSGLTCSTLQSISTNFSVDYDSACGGSTAFTSMFTGQIAVNGGTFSAAGDSGSLIVTSDTARPVALLFAGNSSNSAGSPIKLVLARAEFNQGGAPTVVGGGDHAVSCSAVSGSSASPQSATASAGTGILSADQRSRVAGVQQRHAHELMQDTNITEVEVGSSLDSPGEGALVIKASASPSAPIPATIEGVRTSVRLIEDNGRVPVLDRSAIDDATTIKEAHTTELMSQSGIQGVGVGRSDDNPAETAIVIYVVKGAAHPPIPATIDGVRTKIIEGDRFRAFGWGKEKKQDSTKCVKR